MVTDDIIYKSCKLCDAFTIHFYFCFVFILNINHLTVHCDCYCWHNIVGFGFVENESWAKLPYFPGYIGCIGYIVFVSIGWNTKNVMFCMFCICIND